jgi:NADH/F420H2 dehydrogenase subunit C
MYNKETEQKQFEAIIEEIGSHYPEAIGGVDRAQDDLVLTIDRSAIHAVLSLMKKSGFDLLLDIDAIDNLKRESRERFEVVYILYSIADNVRLRLKVFVPESDPVLPTATGLWNAANWGEREAFDMMGIRFDGHPNLVRILTHHQFEGHALRKDYPIMKEQWCTSTCDMREDLEKDS